MPPATESSSNNNNNNGKITVLNVLNLISYIANIGLVSGVPSLFHLPDNAQVSGKYQTLVTPAGWAFAIWGLIFLMQAIWAIVQITVPTVRTNPLVVNTRGGGVGYNYIAVCAFQVAWTFAFGFEQITLSMIWMLGILYYLIRIHVAQEKGFARHHTSNTTNTNNYWLLRFPFGLHLGWIVAATLVNANVVLVAHGASTLTQFYAAIFTVVVALLAAVATLYKETTTKPTKNPNLVVPLVLVWALNAISKELNHPKTSIVDTFTTQEINVVKNSSLVAALLILVSTLGVTARAWWKKNNGDDDDDHHRDCTNATTTTTTTTTTSGRRSEEENLLSQEH